MHFKIDMFYDELEDRELYPYTQVNIDLVNHICLRNKKEQGQNEIQVIDISKGDIILSWEKFFNLQ